MEDTSFEKGVEAMKCCIRQDGCIDCPAKEGPILGVWYIDGRRYDTCCEGISAFTLKLLKDQFNNL